MHYFNVATYGTNNVVI